MLSCHCEMSDKQRNAIQSDAFDYVFRCTWSEGDRNTYSVEVTATRDDEALRLATTQCPYEPPRGPDDR